MTGRTILRRVGLGAGTGLLAALAATAGCSGRPDDAGAAPGPAARPEAPVEVKEYPLKGEVRAVDAEGRQLQIRHEAIPDFMPAMTMPFKMPEGADLEEFHPGDQVEGTLRVESQAGVTVDYRLQGLEVVKPALATPPPSASGEGPGAATIPGRLRPGDEVPDFTMTDQDGSTRRLSDLRGKVVVLTFVYTRCPLPEFCPMMDRKFGDLQRAVSATSGRAAKVRLVSLSFDPEHDTPEVLRKHAAIRGARPPVWAYATAPQGELAKVAAPLGLVFGPMKGEIVHNLCTAVIGPDGRLARLEVGTRANAWTTSDMLKSVVEALPAGEAPAAG